MSNKYNTMSNKYTKNTAFIGDAVHSVKCHLKGISVCILKILLCNIVVLSTSRYRMEIRKVN